MRKHKATVALVAVAFAVGMAAMTTAQPAPDSEDDSDFNVTVSEQTAVKVNPSQLTFDDDIFPGSEHEQSSDTEQFTGVEIENAGSVQLERIWATTTKPSERPFGTGDSGAYDTGNFIMGEVDSEQPVSQGGLAAVSRVEFADNDLGYVVPSTGSGSEYHYGRIRMGEDEFFWLIQADGTANSANNICDGEDGADTLLLGNEAQTIDQIGSVDFTDPSEYTEYPIEPISGDYGYVPDVNVTTTGSGDGDQEVEERNFDVVTYCDVEAHDTPSQREHTFVMWSKWDPLLGDGFIPPGAHSDSLDINEDLEAAEYGDTTDHPFDDGGGEGDGDASGAIRYITEDPLQPGEHFEFGTHLNLPLGVAAGMIEEGDLIINVESVVT